MEEYQAEFLLAICPGVGGRCLIGVCKYMINSFPPGNFPILVGHPKRRFSSLDAGSHPVVREEKTERFWPTAPTSSPPPPANCV